MKMHKVVKVRYQVGEQVGLGREILKIITNETKLYVL